MRIINILSPIVLGVFIALFVTTCVKKNRETERANTFEKMYLECLAAPIVHDTTWQDSVVYVPVPKPYPVVDTMWLDKPVVISGYLRYNDTIPYGELDLSYDITGYIDDMSFAYDLKVPKVIEHTKVVTHEVEVPYCKPKLYLYGTIRTDFRTVCPGIQLTYKKITGGYEYDLSNSTHNVRAGYRFN